MTLLLLLVAQTIPAKPSPQLLSFEQALNLGAKRPAAQAAQALAKAQRARAKATWRRALLPTVGGQAKLEATDRLLSLQTPMGAFPFGSQSGRSVAVSVTQPILDAPVLLYEGPAADLQARSAEASASRSREEMALRAAERFLDVLSLDARRRALQAYIDSLTKKREEVRAMLEVGRAMNIDQLRLNLALNDAEQQRVALEQSRNLACAALAQAVGISGEVEPDPQLEDRPRFLLSKESSIRFALAQRDDLRALELQLEALQKQQSGVWSELIPKVQAQGSFLYNSALPYDTDHYFTGALSLSWTPFVSLTRPARAEAISAQRAALSARLTEARRGARLAVIAALTSLRTAEDAADIARESVRQAEEARRVEATRYNSGQITISELLEVEALLSDQRTKRDLARLEVVRAETQLMITLGKRPFPRST